MADVQSAIAELRWGKRRRRRRNRTKLECGPMPKVMVALQNTGGALCSMPRSLA